jgi:ABC-type transport system substrate-binding protein
MKIFMRKHLTLLFVGACLLSLSACKKSSGDQSGKKVFRYNQAEGLTSLDPAFARNQANIWAITQMYNGLFEIDKYLHAVPALVDSWDVSEDGKTYTFKIQKGIRFQDSECFPNRKGREVTAEDFVYSFKRIIDPATSSTGSWIFNDKVLTDAKGVISDTAFKATDPYTLKIYLRRPFPPFLLILTMPYTSVVAKEAVEKYGKEFSRHPVGTGPFRFDKWEDGTGLVMLKNENYWRQDENNQPLPYLDAVQVSFIPDKNQAFSAFTQDKLDFISGIEEGSKDVVLNKDGSIKKEFEDKYRVFKSPYLNTEYIGFQLDSSKYTDKKHPFLDRRVRQAMSYGVNRRDLVAFLRNKLGIPGEDGIIPPVMPSFDSSTVTGYTFNLDKAQQLMKEAGFGGGKGFPTVKLYTNPNHKDVSEFLQRAWKDIGINVEIETNNLATHQEMVDNGKVNLFRGSWLGDYPDAENYLAMFYSHNFAPNGPNKTHFRNKDFDNRFESVMLEQDGFKRYQVYHAMDELVMVEAPVVVLYYDEVLRLSQKRVKGIDVNYMNLLQLERVDFRTEEEIKNDGKQAAAR